MGRLGFPVIAVLIGILFPHLAYGKYRPQQLEKSRVLKFARRLNRGPFSTSQINKYSLDGGSEYLQMGDVNKSYQEYFLYYDSEMSLLIEALHDCSHTCKQTINAFRIDRFEIPQKVSIISLFDFRNMDAADRDKVLGCFSSSGNFEAKRSSCGFQMLFSPVAERAYIRNKKVSTSAQFKFQYRFLRDGSRFYAQRASLDPLIGAIERERQSIQVRKASAQL